MATTNVAQISPYRAMWIVVMFDLPVTTKAQRRRAAQFRKGLLQDGYTMVQFSIYSRPCLTDESAGVHLRRVEKMVPEEGRVRILRITDQQYQRMLCFEGSCPVPGEQLPGQMTLF